LSGLRVLIVDDNATNRRILSDTVSRWGMKPRTENGGEAGLRALHEARSTGAPFALVLSDVQMPQMDGFSFLSRIREDPALANQKVIMLTSGRLPGYSDRCRELAVSCELSKPVARLELLTAIQRALGTPDVGKNIPPATPASILSLSRGVRILLAEDNLVNQRVAVRILEKHGYDVVVAGNGHEALAVLERENFDLILMDLQMPGMGGLEATAAIRKMEKATGAHVPIIAMTASAMQGDERRCLQAGMDDYVSKPVHMQDLVEKVESYTSANLKLS
jgi:two-component system sensor histidine kinase/response regulator